MDWVIYVIWSDLGNYSGSTLITLFWFQNYQIHYCLFPFFSNFECTLKMTLHFDQEILSPVATSNSFFKVFNEIEITFVSTYF